VNWRSALLLSTATWLSFGKAFADRSEDQAQTLELTFPVSVNGRLAGNVLSELTPGSQPNIDADQLMSLLSQSLDQGALSRIFAQLPDDRRVALSELREAGLDIVYNERALLLEITASEAQTRQQILSISGASRPVPADYAAPARFAAGVTASLLTEYRHETIFADKGLQPLETAAVGFVNFGGFEGYTLDFDVRVRDDGEFIRNGIVLSKDDYDRGIRYAAGEIIPQVTGFQATPSIGGISISRQFSAIQPFRDIRPNGQQGLYLQRDALVEVVVNGVVIRTLNLAAGRYELRDFPFIGSAMDVQFFVEDSTGRQQVASLSLFGSDELLEPGLSVFSANLGLVSETRVPNEQYDGDLAFSGFYERGLTSNFTLGGNLQATSTEATAGIRLAAASSLGRLSTDIAASSADFAGEQKMGYAFSANYRQFFDISPRTSVNLDFAGNVYSENFSTLGDGIDIQPREWDAAGRASIQLPWSGSLTFGARASKGRGNFPDEQQYDVAVSQLFGRINTFTSFGYDAISREVTARVGLNLRWGERSAVRSSYNSGNDTYLFEVERQSRLQAGDLSGRAGYERRLDSDFFSADGLYRGNRFETSIRHTYAAASASGAVAEQVTTARLTSGLGITSKGWALGRRTDEGFAIVRSHKTLRGRKIDLGATYATGAVARVDGWGAVAVPVLQPYAPQAVRVDVRDLPVGYDIGAAEFKLLPGAGSGYNFTVGSDASLTIIGTLVTEGRDLYLTSGTLTSLKTGEAKAFFTNRTGRFVVERVAPGSYELRLNDGEEVTVITISESEDAYVDLGTISVR